jgi:hypothetical protein
MVRLFSGGVFCIRLAIDNIGVTRADLSKPRSPSWRARARMSERAGLADLIAQGERQFACQTNAIVSILGRSWEIRLHFHFSARAIVPFGDAASPANSNCQQYYNDADQAK